MNKRAVYMSLDVATERVVVQKPSLYDSEERFQEYKRAVEGVAVYDRATGRDYAALDKLGSLTCRLRDANFAVELSPEAKNALQRYSASQMFDLQRVRERIAQTDSEITNRTSMRLFWYQKPAAEWIALRRNALLADDMGVGKEQPVSEPVLTPNGWRPIGHLRVGDEVISRDGHPTRVTGVFPQGRKTVYRVTLSDGASTRAGADHLWQLETTNDRARKNGGRVMTTREIIDAGLRMNASAGRDEGNYRWYVPVAEAIHFAAKDLPIEPYLLGALIANGNMTGGTPKHTGTDEQRAQLAKSLAHANVEMRAEKDDRHTVRLSHHAKNEYGSNPLTDKIRALGLDCTSPQKFIPAAYLLGSVEQRLSMLQGLMDNDGTVDKRGLVEYNTTSPRLAEDVLALVRSLGGVAWKSTRVPKYTYKGELREGLVDHRVRMSLPRAINPFRVTTKRERYLPPTKYPPSHAIANIEECGEEESVCIRVAAEDHLYVTSDFVVTHNTATIIVALPPNAPVVVVCPTRVKNVWVTETETWRPNLKTAILEGRNSFRWPEAGEIVIINPEILPEVHDKDGVKGRKCTGLLPPEPCPGCLTKTTFAGSISTNVVPGEHLPDCTRLLKPKPCPGCAPILDDMPDGVVLVFDEAHLLKHHKSARTQRWRAMARVVMLRHGRVWGLTGTPLENHPDDLWEVYRSLGIEKEAFGTKELFAELFEGQKSFVGERFTGYKWPEPDDEYKARVKERVKPRLQRVSLRRLYTEVAKDLPERRYQDVEVEIDRKTLAACDVFLKKAGGLERILEIISKSDEVKGIDGLPTLRMALAAAKIPAMLDQIASFEEQEEPLVVYSVHHAPIKALADRPGWAIITGDEKVDIAKITADFQAGKLRGVGMTNSGAHGLTLTRARYMLRVDHDWRPTIDMQSEARIYRIGQLRGVIYFTLVANHVLERRVREIHAKKRGYIAASVDAAAVSHDVPSPIDEEIALLQQAASNGGAIRRIAANDEERALVAELHSAAFDRPGDERIATNLAEEAIAIGLSEPQWTLARRVLSRARAVENGVDT